MNKEEGVYFWFYGAFIFREDTVALTLKWESETDGEKENVWFWGNRMSNFTEDASCEMTTFKSLLGSIILKSNFQMNTGIST